MMTAAAAGGLHPAVLLGNWRVWAVVVAAVVLIPAWGLVQRFREDRSGGGSAARSSNSLARRSDLGSILVSGPEAGRMIFGQVRPRGRRRFLATQRQASLVVMAPPRTGKTRSIVGPIDADWVGPAAVFSLRSDVLPVARAGEVVALYPGVLMGPSGRPVSDVRGIPLVGWSPLDGIAEAYAAGGPGAAFEVALATGQSQVPITATSSQDPMWAAGARGVASALLLAAVIGGRTLGDYLRWAKDADLLEPFLLLTEPVSDAPFPDYTADEFTGFRPLPGVPAAAVQTLSGMARYDEKLRSSYMTTLASALTVYDWPSVRAAAELPPARRFRPSWLLDGNGDRRRIYLIGSEDDQAKYASIFLGILSEIRRARSLDANRRNLVKKDSERYIYSPDEDLLLMLDEAANLVPIPDLGTMITTAGGNGISMLLVYHDLSQLRERLGDHGAGSVFSACQARVIFGGIGDTATLTEFSRLSGQQEVSRLSTSEGNGGSSRSQSSETTQLLPEATIRRLPRGQLYAIYGGLPVLRGWLRDPVRRDDPGEATGDDEVPAVLARLLGGM